MELGPDRFGKAADNGVRMTTGIETWAGPNASGARKLALAGMLLFVSFGCGRPGGKALLEAAGAGDVGQVADLLRRGAAVNSRGPYTWVRLDGVKRSAEQGTALLAAIGHGQDAAARLLLSRGADPNLADSEGDRAVLIAAIRKDADAVHALLAAGAKPNFKDQVGFTPLFAACFSSQPEVVAELLGAGADPSEPSVGGMTPLMAAIMGGYVRSERAPGSPPIGMGVDPSKEAARLAVLQELVGHGADVNVQAAHGSALTMTVITGDAGAAKYLTQHGADPHAQIEGGPTAYQMAASFGRKDIVEVFKAAPHLRGPQSLAPMQYRFDQLPRTVWSCNGPLPVLRSAPTEDAVKDWAKSLGFGAACFRATNGSGAPTACLVVAYVFTSGVSTFNVHVFIQQPDGSWRCELLVHGLNLDPKEEIVGATWVEGLLVLRDQKGKQLGVYSVLAPGG